MYSQQDLDDAVASGALSADAAVSLRSFIEQQRELPAVDEEHFRLITGFNDIFVAIAAAILLFAVGWIGQSIGQSMGLVVEGNGPSPIAPAAVAAVSWALALFFTAKRRMALPSIMLLLTFVGGVTFAAAFTFASIVGDPGDSQEGAIIGTMLVLSGAIGAVAAWLHWRRFKVPITIAAGALTASATIVGIVIAIMGDVQMAPNLLWSVVLLLGIGVFLFAMRWDSSDQARQTRRSDVAFWLHLLAAPMIVHPVFTLLGLNDGNATIAEGVVVILLYVVLGITALAIDRRALLVSALAYVLYALQALFREFGAVELNIALTALVIGSALLMLSAFWHQARRAVVQPLPGGLQSKLPLLDRPVSPVPAA